MSLRGAWHELDVGRCFHEVALSIFKVTHSLHLLSIQRPHLYVVVTATEGTVDPASCEEVSALKLFNVEVSKLKVLHLEVSKLKALNF